MRKIKSVTRPNLHKRLFWEFRYDDINWHEEYAVIIERVIERGNEQEWEELIKFYGKDRVVNTLKNETNYLPDEIIEDVCRYFNLKPIELNMAICTFFLFICKITHQVHIFVGWRQCPHGQIP